MSTRELIILGTAAQVPTRERNHNGYFLKWNNDGILFDPGEGTQRQMTYADVSASQITHIAITHFHGDHCLGLPGVIQRLSLDKSPHDVNVYFPASGECFYNAMTHASLFQNNVQLLPKPTTEPGILFQNDSLVISTLKIDHRTECWGYRIDEPDSRSICMEELAKYGITGPKVGILKRDGIITTDDGRTIRLEDVSVARKGQSFAFVMDTRPCENAIKLAKDVDILLTEATYLDSEAKQAHEYMHMTARQAASLAKEAGAQHLSLSHFSQRYQNYSEHLQQAREVFSNTHLARDLEHFDFPKRIRFQC
ncbi:MAG: ribonuclease Z [Proteobacteria bacterium]|nr:ribonuclease Z [Pseudomonadota bacterium]